MEKNTNTFGDYAFLDWVPSRAQELIVGMWGIMGRTYEDWIENSKIDTMEVCNHGPGPNGFGHPPMGATADYVLLDTDSSKIASDERYKIVRGRYIHHWSNMGSIVDECGARYSVSTCDRWIRVWQYGEIKPGDTDA